MKESGRGQACANIALTKYWGKRPGTANAPATPSISLTLDPLRTETTVQMIDTADDQVVLNGVEATGRPKERIVWFLDIWRDKGLISGSVFVSSFNSFPTAAGLASSASGFAALTMALADLAQADLSRRELSRLARLGSGSAARSIFGGIAAMPLGDNPAARCVLEAEATPWTMVIAVVDAPEKTVGSTEGMERSRTASPYYRAWTALAKKDYATVLHGVMHRDFTRVGETMEANMYAMHGCMLATRPSLPYWSPGTLEVLQEAKVQRSKGLEAYATVDAGAHVALLCRHDDADAVADMLSLLMDRERVMICRPAGHAEIPA
ncbi:diphosphomevalonate decarboxylase [bacterium]|nr:diphosphomevalonate decarboxylase [bacterium]